MKKEYLLNFPHIDVTLVSLIIFFGIFAGMLVWIYRKNSGPVYDKLSKLPLED